MAVPAAIELGRVRRSTARLEALLQQARAIKLETTVEPPLPSAAFAQEIEAIHDGNDEQYDQQYQFNTLESAARAIFYSRVSSASIDSPDFIDIWNLLDIILTCGDREKCMPELPCYLLEELLDSQTTDGCRIVFDYLDSRRERLAQKDFNKKHLIFLRACNELLRRLSRAEDAIFCGRVFFFLFQTFPLGDKSSVNLRGEYHVENTTKFDNLETTLREDNSGQMDTEIDADPQEVPTKQVSTPPPQSTGKLGNKAIPIKAPPKKIVEEELLSNRELYPIFWKLQHDFSDPVRLFESENFSSFKRGLGSTITKFKKTHTVVQTKAGEDDQRGLKRKFGENDISDDSNDHLKDTYNPKYLTSPDLFDLELSDLAFQRHILVQALILIDFLLSLTEKAKKQLAELPSTNKSMLYQFTLNEEDTKWATSTRSVITSYLTQTQEGKQYCRMVETVLARDKNWVRWKVESCPSIIRDPVDADTELQARQSARETTQPRRLPTKPLGAMDLSFLDDTNGGGLDALKDPSRYTVPTMEELVEKVKLDKLDLDFAADDQEKASFENAIQNATWRALRQARSSDLNFLDTVDSSKDLEDMLKDREGTEQPQALEQNGEDFTAAVATTDEKRALETQILPLSGDYQIMEGAETA